jgi:hypothetical protein
MDTMTKSAIRATLHCLLGCAIGEVIGMVIGSALDLHAAFSVTLSILLAFLFGYSFSIWPVLKSGLSPKNAIKVTLAGDTVSITSMEIVDNVIILLIPGALMAGLESGLFWGSLVVSLAVAFVVTVPVNRFLIVRGKGHAVMHKYHNHNNYHDH